MSKIGRTLGFWILAAVALPLCAQNFGDINGTVTDTSGAVVAGANVTVTNTATSAARQFQTNATGNYAAPFLMPGMYSVRVEHSSFRQTTRTEINLEVGAAVRIDFTLELGAVTESVDVKSDAVLLATESTSLGAVIEQRRIVELPLNGRNYIQLLALDTNVTAEAGSSGSGTTKVGGDRSTQNYSISGMRLQFNNYLLDGIANTDPNFNNFIFRPSIDAIQEFKIETGIYSAQFGRQPGQISVTTKPGTNEYHAAVFEFLRNSDMDARAFDQSTGSKNPFRQNQYGFYLGGRLIRNRLFFTSNYEGLRESLTTQSLGSVATARMLSGDFSKAGRNIFDPSSRVYTTVNGNPLAVSATPFPGNVIPATRFSAIDVKLLAFYPQATVPGDSIVNNYVRQGAHPTTQDEFTQRIDFNESAKSFWFGRYGWNNEFVRQSSTFELQEGKISTIAHQYMVSNIRTPRPNIVNEFRFGYTFFYNALYTHFAEVSNPVAGLGIVGLNDPGPYAWGTPGVGFANGLTGFGDPVDGPYVNHNHAFQWLDNVSIVRGSHSLKFGGEVRRDQLNQFGQVYLRGNPTFDGTATYDPASRSTTGYSFADYLLGWAAQWIGSPLAGQVQGRATSFSLYAEDAWKVSPKLTLTLGLRYEVVPWGHDKGRSLMNIQMFDPGVGPSGLLAGTKTPVLVREGSGDFYQGMVVHFPDSYPTSTSDTPLGGSDLVKTAYNNLGPRIGLAYSPSKRWSFRAGWGVFYAHDITNSNLMDMARNLVPRVTVTANTEVPNIPIGSPYQSTQGATTACSNWSGFCSPVGATLFLVDSNNRTPYIMEWIANVQRQLTESALLEVGYIGSDGHKLQRLRQDYNAPIPRTGPGDASTALQRTPWPGIGLLEGRMDEGNSTYEGLSTKLTQRFTRGLMYMLSYTWSKSIDNGSAVRASSNDNYTVNPYSFTEDRGLSAFNVGRRLSASMVYELPVGRGKAFLNHGGVVDAAFGGWQLGSLVTLADGVPTSIGNIPWNAGQVYNNVPDAVAGVSYIPANRTPTVFWNLKAFNYTDPGLLYRRGDVARDTLLCPGTINWDFSAAKSFRIKERHALQYRFEAFDFPNHPNLNPPSSTPTSPSFGIVTSAKPMRQLQMALKYTF